MQQFADALEEGFRGRRDVDLEPMVLHELGLVRRLAAERHPVCPPAPRT